MALTRAQVVVVSKFISFVLGCILAMIALMGLWNENFLEVKVWNRNLLWYFGVTGTGLALFRSLSADDDLKLRTSTPEEDLQAAAVDTHYLPKRWSGNAHKWDVYEEVVSLFPYAFQSLLSDVAGVFITAVLCFTELQHKAGAIMQFIQNCTVCRDQVGSICSMSDFRFDRHGNPKFGSRQQGAKKLRAPNGKMEKSFISFNIRWGRGAGRGSDSGGGTRGARRTAMRRSTRSSSFRTCSTRGAARQDRRGRVNSASPTPPSWSAR